MDMRLLKRTISYWVEDVRYRLGLGTGSPPHFLKRRIVRHFGRRFDVRCLIETGTCFGDMTAAMTPYFEQVYSIELSFELYREARKRLSMMPNVRLYWGDSGAVLPTVLNSCDQRALFWLDAHYAGGVTARGEADSPIRRELVAILSHKAKGHVILIDDARCFAGTNGYPTIQELREFVSQYHPDYTVSVSQDIIRLIPSRAIENDERPETGDLAAREPNV